MRTLKSERLVLRPTPSTGGEPGGLVGSEVTSPSGETQIAPIPAPDWARLTAHAAVLTTVPSGLWRVAMAVGVPVGFTPEVLHTVYDVPGLGSLLIIGISAVQEALALLALGLVRPWGEVIPQWIPLAGGKRVRPLAVVIPAALGSLILTSVAVSQILLWGGGGTDMSAPGRMALGICYLPLALWGPLLAVATASYYVRHRHRSGGRSQRAGQ
jgi:hypothetical protein